MTTPACSHGFEKPSQCIDCMTEGNLPPPPKPPPVTVEGRFAANYEGFCRGCDDPIEIGQRIARLSNGTYVHQECEP